MKTINQSSIAIPSILCLYFSIVKMIVFVFVKQDNIDTIKSLYSINFYIENQRCLGGPPKFWSMRCSIGPLKFMFYCIFKKEFWGCVVLWDQIFLEKSVKNSIHFRKFFQKINVLRFKMVSNGEIMKNFDEITHKSPHSVFFENFRKFRKFSRILEI